MTHRAETTPPRLSSGPYAEEHEPATRGVRGARAASRGAGRRCARRQRVALTPRHDRAGRGGAGRPHHPQRVASFRAVLRYAMRHQAIGANPAEALDRATPLAGSRFEHRLLTGPQVALLATQVGERSHPAYGLMILFLAYTGLRRAEVQGLEVRDLMLTTGPDGAIKGSIRVARTKTRRHSEWVTGTSEDEAVQAHRAPAALARRADGRLPHRHAPARRRTHRPAVA